MEKEAHFIEIQNSRKIWAIGSIHSRLEAFNSLKEYIRKPLLGAAFL